MDMMKILQRSWDILWKYRVLWIFGFILALTVGGSSLRGPGGTSSYQTNRPEVQNLLKEPWNNYTFRSPQDFFDWLRLTGNQLRGFVASQVNFSTVVTIVVVFVVLVFITSIAMTILRYVSETSVVRMVDQYEASGEMVSFKKGFGMGWSKRSWRLFLIDLLLLALPGLIVMILFILIGWSVFSSLLSGRDIMAAGIIMLAGVVFFLALATAVYFVLVNFLRNFIMRTCALEDAGVMESIKKGLSMARKNWKDAGLMWLVMIGLGIAWFFVSILILVVLIPVLFVSGVLGLVAGGIPGIFTWLMTSVFVPANSWAIAFGILFGVPFFLLVTFSPFLFVEGLVQVFKSTVWTLVYREFKPETQELPAPEQVSS